MNQDEPSAVNRAQRGRGHHGQDQSPGRTPCLTQPTCGSLGCVRRLTMTVQPTPDSAFSVLLVLAYLAMRKPCGLTICTTYTLKSLSNTLLDFRWLRIYAASVYRLSLCLFLIDDHLPTRLCSNHCERLVALRLDTFGLKNYTKNSDSPRRCYSLWSYIDQGLSPFWGFEFAQ